MWWRIACTSGKYASALLRILLIIFLRRVDIAVNYDIGHYHARVVQGAHLAVQFLRFTSRAEVTHLYPELRRYIGHVCAHIGEAAHEVYLYFSSFITVIPAVYLHTVSSARVDTAATA